VRSEAAGRVPSIGPFAFVQAPWCAALLPFGPGRAAPTKRAYPRLFDDIRLSRATNYSPQGIAGCGCQVTSSEGA
jgi:hypothetical protein